MQFVIELQHDENANSLDTYPILPLNSVLPNLVSPLGSDKVAFLA
jgi:hypothetical protein